MDILPHIVDKFGYMHFRMSCSFPCYVQCFLYNSLFHIGRNSLYMFRCTDGWLMNTLCHMSGSLPDSRKCLGGMCPHRRIRVSEVDTGRHTVGGR